VELHEDGPLIEFLINQVDKIPGYIAAIAAVVSAWAATRQQREATLEKDDLKSKSGTEIVIGDIKVQSDTNLSPDELTELAIGLGRLQERRERARFNPRSELPGAAPRG
jgi:hypothetical protein